VTDRYQIIQDMSLKQKELFKLLNDNYKLEKMTSFECHWSDSMLCHQTSQNGLLDAIHIRTLTETDKVVFQEYIDSMKEYNKHLTTAINT